MRNLYVSLRKNLTSAGFWLCAAMTVLLLFTAEIYTDYDTMNRYSVFRALTEFPREKLSTHYEMYNTTVIQNARGGWFTLFAPIIAAFCFVPLMCTEREENAVRFQIFRVSKIKYSVTEFLSGAISGGLAMAAGYALFAGAAMILFPGAPEGGADLEIYGVAAFNFPKLLLEMWLYGAFWSTPAMFCTSITRNKYIVMCIPFFLKYGLAQTYQKLLLNAFSDENFDENALKFASTINPDGILWTSDYTRLSVILMFGISAAVFFAGYIIINQKRGDCGA